MSDDIVKRLRVWSDWLDERVPDTAVGNDLREAADEIERLRKERDEAEQMRSDIQRLCAEIRIIRIDNMRTNEESEKFRNERDEARRKICEIESQSICDPPRSPQRYARLFGWDCFKEDTND
jgi:uncharacterized coiled-coil DUF342 family protein